MVNNHKSVSNEELQQIEISPKISHLSVHEINEVINKYYAGEKLRTLRKDYGVPATHAALLKTIPPLILKDKCPYCDVNLVKEREARKPGTYVLKTTPYCQKCLHKTSKNCRCSSCLQEQEKKLQAKAKEKEEQDEINKIKRELIHMVYGGEGRNPIPETSLDPIDILFLSSLMRCGLNDKMDGIEPVENYHHKMTPTTDLASVLVKHLLKRRLIYTSPESPIAAFKEDNDFPKYFNPYMVRFKVNIKPVDDNFQAMIQRFLYPDNKVFLENTSESLTLWRLVAFHEVQEYFEHLSGKMGLLIPVNEKINSVFNELLNHFSVAQICYIIYRGLKFTSNLMTDDMQKLETALINNFVRFGEKTQAENLKMPSFSRNYNLPESMISKILFDRLLKISSLGFDEVPTDQF